MNLLYDLLLFVSALICTLLFFLMLEKYTKNIQPEYTRRISHIGGSFSAIIFVHILPAYIFITTLISFTLIMILSKKTKFFAHIHDVSRLTFGEELLPIGFLSAFIISNNLSIFIFSVLIIGIADPIVGVIMQKYNNHLLGLLSFFIITFSILLFSDLTLQQNLLIALIAALTERISIHGSDNLTVPIVTSLLLNLF